jgi:hypothetical protein
VENIAVGNYAYIVSQDNNGNGNFKNYAAFTNGNVGITNAGLTYVYYYSDGTKLNKNMVPSKDGEYTVEVYVTEGILAANYTKANIDITKPAATLKLYIGCDATTSGSITDSSNSSSTVRGYYIEDGKMYDGDDDLVRSQHVTLNGVEYYANKNGVIVHGKIFTDVNGVKYYADETGAIVKDGIYDIVGGKVYAYEDGKLLVSGSKTVDGVKYVAAKSGKLVKNGFTTTAKGYKYYVENYKVVTNKKFTYTNGKTYIATKSGSIAKGGKVVTFNGKKYYVYAKGSVAKSKTVSYKGKTYVASKTGVLTQKKK